MLLLLRELFSLLSGILTLNAWIRCRDEFDEGRASSSYAPFAQLNLTNYADDNYQQWITT